MMAISGISYLATGKSLSDNAFSLMTNRDCALHRIMMNEAVCEQNKLSPSDNDGELLFARSKMVSAEEIEVTIPKSIINFVEYVAPDVLATSTHASISDFSVVIQDTKTHTQKYSSAQTFAVVGSFNNYQYAQRRSHKYVYFNPRIIKNQPRSPTKYRVVVGPVKHEDFIAALPIMVGAETKLPWEINLCVDDMSPPPCNNTLVVKTL